MQQTWVLDFDDTLAMTNLGFVQAINKKFGTRERVSNVTSWAFWEKHPHADYIWSTEVFGSPLWTARLAPAPFAVELANRLAELDPDVERVYLLSDRPNTHQPWLEAWLASHNVSPTVEVVVTNRRRPKVDIAIELGATHLIDDSPVQLNLLFKQAERFERIYVMDYLYNQHLHLPPNAVRVENLLDVLCEVYPERYPRDAPAPLLG